MLGSDVSVVDDKALLLITVEVCRKLRMPLGKVEVYCEIPEVLLALELRMLVLVDDFEVSAPALRLAAARVSRMFRVQDGCMILRLWLLWLRLCGEASRRWV